MRARAEDTAVTRPTRITGVSIGSEGHLAVTETADFLDAGATVTARAAPTSAGTHAAFRSPRGDVVERASAVGEERGTSIESSRGALDCATSDEPSRVSLNVDLSLISESQFYAGLDGDVAGGGLFVATYRHLTIGTFVDIAL